MITKNRMLVLAAGLLLTAMGPALAEGEGWSWSVGPVYRGDMEVKFTGRSYVQEFGLHGANAYQQEPSGAASAAGYADRTYEDGFVNVDPGTVASGDGLTWFWGYESPAQYNAAADTLSFAAGSGGARLRHSVVSSTDLRGEDTMDAWGIGASAGRDLMTKGRVKVGIRVGGDVVWGIESTVRQSTYSERLSRETFSVVDVYDLEGVVPPAAPYAGTLDGPGPLIANIPGRRAETVTGGSSWTAENEVMLDLTIAIQELWVGPRVDVELAKGVTLFGTPYVSLTRVDARVERDEWFRAVYPDGRTDVLESWNDRKVDEELRFGVGVRAGARAQLSGPWFAELGVAYEKVDDLSIGIGPNNVEVDLSGYNVSAHVGRGF